MIEPMNTERSLAAGSNRESGVTLIEMVIAILILTVGLVSLAQLFIVASYNNTYAVATSGGVNDAQRLVEFWKARAVLNGADDPMITSGTWNEETATCTPFEALLDEDGDPYDFDASAYKPSVWVFDTDGNLVGSATPSLPPGISAGTLRAPAKNSRYVYILMTPKTKDPRYGQTVQLSAIVSGLNNT